jgi:CheY-like chemotaxis protein
LPAGWKPWNQAYACVEVSDTGCGIDDEDIPKIFEPFFTNKFVGRGLGLPVVLGILHAHSGGLVVNSSRGRESGSSFQAYLPLSTELVAPVRLKNPAPAVPEPLWEGCVLLVEDEVMLRSAAKAVLARIGFTVLEAANGMEALGLFRQHKDTIRLVLCDVTMPHMGGWETLAAVRAIAPGMPFILSSGYDEAEVMSADSAEQPQAFLAKPYTVDELRAAIRPALARRG